MSKDTKRVFKPSNLAKTLKPKRGSISRKQAKFNSLNYFDSNPKKSYKYLISWAFSGLQSKFAIHTYFAILVLFFG